MDPEMDTSEMRVPLQGVAKIFKAGLKSKTWDIHGMPHFITTTHREGCDMCKAYALHIVEASKALTVEIPPREVEEAAFQITWPNIVHHICRMHLCIIRSIPIFTHLFLVFLRI